MDVLDKIGVGTLWSICKTKFALTGHTHTKVGDGSIIIYPMASNEVNFGGSNKESTIYFGYRKMDDRPVPTNFVFGGIGTATLTAAKFKGALEGNASTASNASKVNGHTVNADVPSGAKFTDTNTWRGIQDNLTSTSTSDSLSANQGKVLKGLVDGKANSSHTHTWSQVTGAPSTATRWPSWGEVTGKPSSFTPSSHTHDDRYYTESEINSKLAAKAVNITLDTNADLNKIIAPGFYNCGGGNSILNKPSGVDAIGLIVTHNASGSYYTQILTTSSNKDTYRRTCLNGTWSAWTQDKYTDTNTWRGIQNNLTSNSTSDSLSAAQGKVLKGLIDSKANSSDLSSYSQKDETVSNIYIQKVGQTQTSAKVTQALRVIKANGEYEWITIENVTNDTDGFMSKKDKGKLDGIEEGANKYTLPVASATTLGGIKVSANKNGGAFPICVNNDGLAHTKIDGLNTNTDGSVESVFTTNPNNNTFAEYSATEIHLGIDETDFRVDFPYKSGTLALTSDCLSSEKGSTYPGDSNGIRINFTSAQQIVLLDSSGNYNISDWYDQSSIGNVLDMYPCGLQGGQLSSSRHKDLFKIMESSPGGPVLASISVFSLGYNKHVRLIHIDKGVLVCPYTLNYS